MGKYFGTDGFRGEAGVNLTAKHAFKIGRFLGWHFSNKHKDTGARIVIGKDTRRSSYMLEYALAAGITSEGADAYLLHVTTTPSEPRSASSMPSPMAQTSTATQAAPTSKVCRNLSWRTAAT